jgi:hypothetical protein
VSFPIASIQEFIIAEELCKDLKLSPFAIVDQIECANTENGKSQDLKSTSLKSIPVISIEDSSNTFKKQPSQINLSSSQTFNKSDSSIGRQKPQFNLTFVQWEEVKRREDIIAKEIETLDNMLNIKLTILGL